jgi:peptidyl-prolyl cis-trans isomerase SurA
LQVEAFSAARQRSRVALLLTGAMLTLAAACNRSVGPDVVATVNGKEIHRAELDRQYQILKISQGDNPQNPSPEQASLERLAVLRQMIDEEILLQRAAKLNVVASDEDVNAKVTERKACCTQEEWDKQLKLHNETMDDFKNDLRKQLTESKLINKEIDSKINITDAEITNYYAEHTADFNFIEPRYNLARIWVLDAPSAQTTNLQNNKASNPADARSKIQALYQKLENGEDFGTIALNFSEDKDTAPNGGDMGFVTESQIHENASPEIYDTISKLKPGQFTGILPINGAPVQKSKPIGYAIYKLISKEAAGQRTLNNVQVQQEIRTRLRNGHAQLLSTAYREMLRDDAKVHNYLADQILREGAK